MSQLKTMLESASEELMHAIVKGSAEQMLEENRGLGVFFTLMCISRMQNNSTVSLFFHYKKNKINK